MRMGRATHPDVDVVIVGGGPAGSTAAYRLASAGARVVVVDRAVFPRDKPCGGGLTMRAVKVLPFSVDPVVEDRVDRLDLRLRYTDAVQHRFRDTIALMTQRRRLDHFLLERAAEAGAEVREGVRVRDIETAGGAPVIVLEGGERMTAGIVLGADGANGVSAKALGLGAGPTYGVALEGNAPMTAARERAHRGKVTLEVATVPGGYAWVFPKGDHINVGVGGWSEEGPRLREHLRRACLHHDVDPAELSEVRGHRMPLRRAWGGVARGRAAVVGDAAGLIDPLTGDGMFEAFVSSDLASAAALDVLAGRATGMEPYSGRLRRALAGHAATAWTARALLERTPDLTWRVMRRPAAARFLGHRLSTRPPEVDVPLIDGLERGARALLGAHAR